MVLLVCNNIITSVSYVHVHVVSVATWATVQTLTFFTPQTQNSANLKPAQARTHPLTRTNARTHEKLGVLKRRTFFK